MESVIAQGLLLPDNSLETMERSMDELEELIDTAGGRVVERGLQKRSAPDPATFFGKGKVQELAALVGRTGATALVVDNELKPGQQRNLEEALDIKVIDRTRLILDIFASRARTREGQLQVELAQLEYRLPRLGGRGVLLDSQSGGIGTRGPGERKLEVDRRRIRDRLTFLRKQIDKIRQERSLQRSQRDGVPVPQVAFVGYTNAGKSTLLNRLLETQKHLARASGEVYADDKLFATLDPTTRQIRLPSGRWIVATDTVGFIRRLPTLLVASFRATLEELSQADLLVHVVDVSDPDWRSHFQTVEEVLKELGVETLPRLDTYNKVDRLSQADRDDLRSRSGKLISARTGDGIPEFLARIGDILKEQWIEKRLEIPYDRLGAFMKYYPHLEISRQVPIPTGIDVLVRTHPATWAQLAHLLKKTQ